MSGISNGLKGESLVSQLLEGCSCATEAQRHAIELIELLGGGEDGFISVFLLHQVIPDEVQGGEEVCFP